MKKQSPPEEFLDQNGTAETSAVAGDDARAAGGARAPEFSDEALALAFTSRYGDELRYIAARNRWFIWKGTHWVPDDTMLVFDLARGICREAALRRSTRGPDSIASAKTVAAVERLARADRRHAATMDQWDCDPWLLNTPGGIVDLRTGRIRRHRRDDYMTKITAVSGGGECPMWHAFLKRITGDNIDLIHYLQRLLGYCLTGSTREHILAFLYGLGANGKSVLLSTVSGLIGDYHRTAPMETFTTSNSDRHPTDLAMLRGARLVTAIETEEGRKWAESRIKTLTGGDPIAARFMRADFFEYVPQFKLLIAGNHRPGLRSIDEAIRRRLHLVPFTVTILPQERDKELTGRLKAEWPGILQWMIDGCLAWQREGLSPPPAVTAATASYLEDEDAMATWFEEMCECKPAAWTSSEEFYGSWKAWAENAGEFVGSQKRLSQMLETRGFEPKRNGKRGFLGVRLRPLVNATTEG